jgi:nucleoside-diphosphate-sugar epimerase
MNLLITGINGFIGTNLYHNFNRKFTITGVDISKDEDKSDCKIYTWKDLGDIPEIDAIIHLAGIAHDTQDLADESKYYEINVGITKQIYEYYLNSSAKKFIYFSSVKAIADTVSGDFLTEEDEPNPLTPYGKSKLEAEKYLLKRPLPTDKCLYIFRPAMVHGPGNKGNMNLLYKVIKNGFPYPLGAYQNKRSYTSIQNLMLIVESFLNNEISSGVFNVCDDEAVSTVTIVDLINKSLNKEGIIWKLPKNLLQGIARVGDICNLPLNSMRLKKMTESYVVSNTKLKIALNIEKLPVTASEGLMYTFRSFLP